MSKLGQIKCWLFECKYGAKRISLEPMVGASCDTITEGTFEPKKTGTIKIKTTYRRPK